MTDYSKQPVSQHIDSATGKPRPNEGTGGASHVKNITQDSVLIQHDDVDVGLIPVAAFYVKDVDTLSMQMEVKENALDQFEIHYRYSEDGDFINMGAAAGDYTTPAYPILQASGSWLTAAVGNGHYLKLDVSGVYAVQLWAASGNAAGSSVSFSGGTK